MSVAQRYMHLSPDVLESSIQLLESRPRGGQRGDIVETASAQNGSEGRQSVKWLGVRDGIRNWLVTTA